jgi:hypothetical protein
MNAGGILWAPRGLQLIILHAACVILLLHFYVVCTVLLPRLPRNGLNRYPNRILHLSTGCSAGDAILEIRTALVSLLGDALREAHLLGK